MSIKDHPNFIATKFTVDIMTSFYESLRGKANVSNIDAEALRQLVMETVEKFENLADEVSDE